MHLQRDLIKKRNDREAAVALPPKEQGLMPRLTICTVGKWLARRQSVVRAADDAEAERGGPEDGNDRGGASDCVPPGTSAAPSLQMARRFVQNPSNSSTLRNLLSNISKRSWI